MQEEVREVEECETKGRIHEAQDGETGEIERGRSKKKMRGGKSVKRERERVGANSEKGERRR